MTSFSPDGLYIDPESFFERIENENQYALFKEYRDQPLAILPVYLPDKKRFVSRNVKFFGEHPTGFISQEPYEMTHQCLAIENSLDAFQNQFSKSTGNILKDLEWSNIVAAGDLVSNSIYHGRIRDLPPDADIDLFLYGLNAKEKVEKIKQIWETICKNHPETPAAHNAVKELAVRTANGITIFSPYFERRVQIALSDYSSIAEILLDFDVDCSAVAFDGCQVYASPRAIAAFISGANLIDVDRISPSYERQLERYHAWGFEPYFPDLERDRINTAIYRTPRAQWKGLAWLLHATNTAKFSFHRRDRDIVFNYFDEPEPYVEDHSDVEPGEEYQAESMHDTFVIPQRLGTNTEAILKYLKEVDWKKNATGRNSDHRHVAFFGAIDEIIGDCCEDCKPQEPSGSISSDMTLRYVSGSLSFMKNKTDQQEEGSSQPITAKSWTKMAYVEPTGDLRAAIINCEFLAFKNIIETYEIDVNQIDHTGQTPLQIACAVSSAEIIEYLLENNAELEVLGGGPTALHIAASRGNVDIIRALHVGCQKNYTYLGCRSNNAIEPKQESDRSLVASNKTNEGNVISSTGPSPRSLDINTLISQKDRTSPVHVAVLYGHATVLELLVTLFGANVDIPLYRSDSDSSGICNFSLASVLPDERRAQTMRILCIHSADKHAIEEEFAKGFTIPPDLTSPGKTTVASIKEMFESLQGKASSVPVSSAKTVRSQFPKPKVASDYRILKFLPSPFYKKAEKSRGLPNIDSLVQDFEQKLTDGDLQRLKSIVERTGFPFIRLSGYYAEDGNKSEAAYKGLRVFGNREPPPKWEMLDRESLGDWSPVYISVLTGKFSCTRWMFSDTVDNTNDTPVKLLLNFLSSKNIDVDSPKMESVVKSVVENWLLEQGNLILHYSVETRHDKESKALIEQIVQKRPQLLTERASGKCLGINTPLSLSYMLQKGAWANTFINLGSLDWQHYKNWDRGDLLHLLLLIGTKQNVQNLIETLDQATVKSLLLEKRYSKQTPLARWLQRVCEAKRLGVDSVQGSSNLTVENQKETITYLFQIAKNGGIVPLDLFGGAGNRSIHEAVKHGLFEILDVILEEAPELCYYEDIQGTTAFEIGKAEWVSKAIRGMVQPVSLHDERSNPWWMFMIECEKKICTRQPVSHETVRLIIRDDEGLKFEGSNI